MATAIYEKWRSIYDHYNDTRAKVCEGTEEMKLEDEERRLYYSIGELTNNIPLPFVLP